MLRDYQQAAVDATMKWMRGSIDPCLLELATGAGKSHIIAAIAQQLNERTGKRVLCLAPSGELVIQNVAKYKATGNPASVFSASAGDKCLRHPVVFGTPGTVKNKVSRFGAEFAAVIVDECFPGDTKISTPIGDVRIDEISAGDVVHCAIGSGIVSSVFSKASQTITVRTKNGKSIRCTPDHPIFTEKGFIEAARLENGSRIFCREDVQALFEIFSAKDDNNKKRKRSSKYFGITLEQAGMLLSILLKEVEKSDAQERGKGKGSRYFEKDWPFSSYKRGKWTASEPCAASNLVRTRKWMGYGGCYKDRCRTFEWSLPKFLQSRHWKFGNENSHRTGWIQSSRNRAIRTRQEKRLQVKRIGMDSVSHIERGRDEVVYNLRVKGHPSYFANGILVHNCHGMTPTIRHIIDRIKERNPRLRVIGLSATPYRLGSGYIYAIDETGKPMTEARDPYFMAKIHTTSARELIERGYLTRPVVGGINADRYETLTMQLNSRGQFAAADVDRAYHGHGRKTAHIIADVVQQARDRCGVMIFAATVRHAQECLASLPPGLSAIVTGDTAKAERESILRRFKARHIKYLVNVSVLTTGFDAPHVDLIAILRATESVGLLQQIIGRGLRIDDDKDDCLVLDYAENIERHCPDGDIFAPRIKTFKSAGDAEPIEAKCPLCGVVNEFSPRQNEEGFQVDEFGYYVDLDGERISTDYGDMPAHHGRRCLGAHRTGPNGEHERCGYRWTFKECPHCGHDNDIAARYCKECKGELVDPNEKLAAEFKALKRDPTRLQTDRVIAWALRPVVSAKGNECLRIDYTTEYRTFPFWLHPYATGGKMLADWRQYQIATDNGTRQPDTVTYRKNAESGYYSIHDYNRAADEISSRD